MAAAVTSQTSYSLIFFSLYIFTFWQRCEGKPICFGVASVVCGNGKLEVAANSVDPGGRDQR